MNGLTVRERPGGPAAEVGHPRHSRDDRPAPPSGRPRVVVHNLASVDGRLDGFPVDLGLYYRLAAALPHEAVLTGSATMLAAAAREGIDLDAEDPVRTAPMAGPGDRRPWLVVVDSGGRLTRFAWLRDQPYWRDVLVLCASGTPTGHLERLRRHGVEHVVVGADRVDLRRALHVLRERFGVTAVRVDAGGALVGVLLRAGLVDEFSVLVAPYLVGTGGSAPVRMVDGAGCGERRWTLLGVQRLADDHLWLRYAPPGTAGAAVASAIPADAGGNQR